MSPLKGLYRIIWAGFCIQVVSGILLLIAYPTKALTNPDFLYQADTHWHRHCVMKMIQKRVFSDSSLTEPAMMLKGRSLAVWSLVLWLGVVTAGRLLAYTFTYINYSG